MRCGRVPYRTLDERHDFGLGVVPSGSEILQRPLLGGYIGAMAYLPPEKIAVAVATTFGEGAFDDQGNYRHSSFQDTFAAIGNHLAPDHPLPLPSS